MRIVLLFLFNLLSTESIAEDKILNFYLSSIDKNSTKYNSIELDVSKLNKGELKNNFIYYLDYSSKARLKIYSKYNMESNELDYIAIKVSTDLNKKINVYTYSNSRISSYGNNIFYEVGVVAKMKNINVKTAINYIDDDSGISKNGVTMKANYNF